LHEKEKMKFRFLSIIFFVLTTPLLIKGQDDSNIKFKTKSTLSGFIRGGFFGSTNPDNNKAYLSSAFSDAGIKIEVSNNLNFSAFSDIRFRYGTEFLKPVSKLDLREAFINVYGKKWNVSAGQKIIKWGRADFTNPTSKLSPQDLVYRSPDREDINMGNLLVSGKWYPLTSLSFEAVAIPYYRSSRLLVDQVKLPFYVTIDPLETLVTSREMFSYGLKTDLHITGVDLSFSLFDGYDPMPGTALTSFNLDLSGAFPIPYTRLEMTPYKIRNFGFDFETTLGEFGLRGEASYMAPYKSWKSFEYIPMPELKWVAGTDWSADNWRFTAEYSGKIIPDFTPSAVDSFIGSEPDMAQMITLMSIFGFNMEDYVRDQVGAYNRLYNYQLEKSYHSAGLRIETELFYGKLIPSFLTLYNFTSRDFLITPEVNFIPADGLKISLAGDYFSGRKGSLYDIADDFMNCVRISLRVDF
jgi:hypothetical protein